MSKSALSRVVVLALAIGLGMALAGCGSKPEGKYVGGGGAMSIEFKSGKATITALGNTETCDYTVDGDKITVTNPKAPGGALIFTIMKDGSLQGGGETYTKAAG